MVSGPALLAASCGFVSVANFVVLYDLLAHGPVPARISRKFYSYIGLDFPPYFIPPEELPRVALDVEESVHNGVGESALSNWEDTVSGTFGWYKLGPAHNLYSSTMYHERHCLRMLYHALVPATAQRKIPNDHAQHCLNYIRQMTLCHPDHTLEPPDALSRSWDVDRGGGSTHVCRDWSLALRLGNESQVEWHNLMAQHWEGKF
ncbi:hypothetical protein AURDEDRAFT_169127 [Auricularia subglabra TFB-10046 SS5]|nr:hypothetical protein AURDEDRAFT_169127 [Auricularia subglabra TFB-10046 SS5]